MIKISLVIATYNRSQSLLRTLTSVAEQQLCADEWECVVVNNNSTDDTAAVVAAFCGRNPSLNIVAVDECNQGLSYARNRGIRESRGRWVAIIDDDQTISPDFLAAYVATFEQEASVRVAGGRIVAKYESERPRWMSRWTERPIANPIDLGDKCRWFPQHVVPGGGNMAIERSFVLSLGLFATDLGRTGVALVGGEENDLFQRIAAEGYPVRYVHRAIVDHYIPDSKLTREYFTRLCYGVGVTQRVRAAKGGRSAVTMVVAECFKWAATLLLAAGFVLMGRPAKAAWLLSMRRSISRGVFGW